MTEMDCLSDDFHKKEQEIVDKCVTARKELIELGFIGTQRVSGEVFSKVFEKRFTYFIHDIKAMNTGANKGVVYIQFMVQFEDNESEFIYLEVK